MSGLNCSALVYLPSMHGEIERRREKKKLREMAGREGEGCVLTLWSR